MKRYLFLCKQKIIYFVHLIFSFFLPYESCIICGGNCKILPLCKNCIATFFCVELNDDVSCNCCGKKLISENQICVRCRTENPFKNIERVFSLFSYKLWNVEIMFRWKKQSERTFSAFFASSLERGIITSLPYIVNGIDIRDSDYNGDGVNDNNGNTWYEGQTWTASNGVVLRIADAYEVQPGQLNSYDCVIRDTQV